MVNGKSVRDIPCQLAEEYFGSSLLHWQLLYGVPICHVVQRKRPCSTDAGADGGTTSCGDHAAVCDSLEEDATTCRTNGYWQKGDMLPCPTMLLSSRPVDLSRIIRMIICGSACKLCRLSMAAHTRYVLLALQVRISRIVYMLAGFGTYMRKHRIEKTHRLEESCSCSTEWHARAKMADFAQHPSARWHSSTYIESAVHETCR